MAVISPNLISIVLVNALNSTDATVTFTIDKKFADNVGTYYNLTDDIATGIIQNIEVTLYNTSTKAVEMMRLSGIVSTTTTSDGRPIYVGTIEVNGATKLRGLANTYDGTTSATNVIANKIITTFPKNSPGVVAVNSGQLQRALSLFASSSVSDTAVAGEDLVARNSVALHTDGKIYKYHFTNYPNLCGILTATTTTGNTGTYTRNGGTTSGHSSLTVGAYQFAENTGAITETPSTTTKFLGQAKSATAVFVVLASPPTPEATQSQAEAGTVQSVMMSPLRTSQHGLLGEVRQFAVTMTNALSIATLRGYGWAVCDGSTPASQGISSPTITTTPNLVASFLKGHATVSGTVAGSNTSTIAETNLPAHSHVQTLSFTGGTATWNSASFTGGAVRSPTPASVPADAISTGTVSTATTGSGTAFTTEPLSYSVIFMMKVR